MLPAPLSVNRPQPTSGSASASTTALSRSSDEGGYASDIGSGSAAHQRLIPSPSQDQYSSHEDYEPANVGRYAQSTTPFETRVSRTAGAHSGVLRQPAASLQHPVEQHNPYGYSQPHSAGYDDPQIPFVTEPEEFVTSPVSTASVYAARARGISLADNGPVPGPGGVRRVSRQTVRRPSSQAPPPSQNRYSRSATAPFPNLPPGAAPPQQGFGY